MLHNKEYKIAKRKYHILKIGNMKLCKLIRLFNLQHQGGFCPSDCDEVGNNRTREVRKLSQ